MKSIKPTTLLFFLLINVCSAQTKAALQKSFDTKLQEIDQLAKTGKVMQAIIEGEDLKTFAYENFKDSNHNLKTILFKLNFYYRYTKDTQNELKTNIELSKVREDDLEFERKSFEESLENLIAFYNDTDNPREVIPTFTEVNKSLFAHAEDALSERYNDEKEIFINQNILPYFHLFHSFAYKYNYKYGILLDMVGAKNATFRKEGFSMQSAEDIVSQIWSLAKIIIGR